MFCKNLDHQLYNKDTYNANITFIYEVKKDCKLPFLDVLLIKKRSNIITTVYRKFVDICLDSLELGQRILYYFQQYN